MSKSTKIDLARASKDELLDFLDKAECTVDDNLSVPMLRQKAMEVQQTLNASQESDELEKRAKAASEQVLSDLGDAEDGEQGDENDGGTVMSRFRFNQGNNQNKGEKLDLDSTDVQPEDGESSSINEIIRDSRRSDYEGESVEERILREQQRKKDDFRTARFVAAADAEIREYHRDAAERHHAKMTNVCFFLKRGTVLSSFTTPYTKIQGVRLRRETPYRALDIELKYFRKKRGMFGECAYDGPDQVKDSSSSRKTK